MKLIPGAVVVLEGIDATGKTTQSELLKQQFPDELFIHQPSGGTVVGEVVYQLTEKVERMHPVARQFLHLAAHAEAYDRLIIPALANGGVVMDRCWWSTLAYGWYASGLRYVIDLDVFEQMVLLPTQGIMPTTVFVFMHAHRRDKHNTTELIDGYWEIAKRYPMSVEPIEIGTPEQVNAQIIRALHRRQVVA